MSAELKRAVELTLCSILSESLAQMKFYPSRGGGDEVTMFWAPNTNYAIGDVVRSNDQSIIKAIVVNVAHTSGSSEPAFTNTPGDIIGNYQILSEDVTSAEDVTPAPEPPFGIVSVDDDEQHRDTIWQLTGRVIWVTSIDRENPEKSSAEAQRIYDVLRKVDWGYDPIRKLMVNGFDISKTDDISDEDKQSRGDTVEFTIGVSPKVSG